MTAVLFILTILTEIFGIDSEKWTEETAMLLVFSILTLTDGRNGPRNDRSVVDNRHLNSDVWNWRQNDRSVVGNQQVNSP